MAISLWHLEKKQERLRREITDHLDFLEGSITTQGATGRFILTMKVKGKTKSRYIRAGMETEVRLMVARHKKLKVLLKELAEVNWEILQLNNPPDRKK